MTSMSGSPTPDGDEDRTAGADQSERKGRPGVELGMSDGTGSTFEPEEDTDGDVEPDG
jgi:hypothetical protein